jgi:hypothetical protein
VVREAVANPSAPKLLRLRENGQKEGEEAGRKRTYVQEVWLRVVEGLCQVLRVVPCLVGRLWEGLQQEDPLSVAVPLEVLAVVLLGVLLVGLLAVLQVARREVLVVVHRAAPSVLPVVLLAVRREVLLVGLRAVLGVVPQVVHLHK